MFFFDLKVYLWYIFCSISLGGRGVSGCQSNMFCRYKFAVIFILCLFTFNSGLAIEEVNFDANKAEVQSEENTKNAVLVTSISFDEVLSKAKEHSFALKMADFDTFIAKTGIKAARAEYFPKLNAGVNAEYNKNFNDILMSTYVGDTYINPYTRFQSLFGLSLSYNIFDFGVRRGYLDLAKEDTRIRELLKQEQIQELELNITDLYGKILITKKQLELNEKILVLSEKNLEMKKRLYNAKEYSKFELNSQTVENKKIARKIYDLKSMLAEYLNYLAFYTGEEYSVSNINVGEFTRPNYPPDEFIDYTKSITWDIQTAAIAKKEQELKIVKRTNFPKVSMYSRYNLYDSHKTNYLKTLGIEPSNYSVGASINMPVFDGLKNSADIDKAKLELEKLYVERDKSIAELKNKLATLRTNYSYMVEQTENSKQILKELKENDVNTNRLLAKGLVSPIDSVQSQIDLLEEKIEFEKNELTAISILRAIQILTTYDKG